MTRSGLSGSPRKRHGIPIFVEDRRVVTGRLLLVLLAVPVLAVVTTLVALRPVQITPLGVRQRVRRRSPHAWRPLAAGILGVWYTAKIQDDPAYVDNPAMGFLSLLFPLSILVGLFLAGSWVCVWISRGLARLSGSATTLIVARRIAAAPYSAFRAVSGATLAIFVATVLGLTAAHDRDTHGETRSVLDRGVVAVHVSGVPEASLAPLTSDGVVVARLAAPRGEWVLPSAGFFAGLGIGVAIAFAVSRLALPFMEAATRHKSVRFE